MTYSVEMFAKMFTKQQRHTSYCEALRRTIKQGDVVIDIGTGIGVYAMEAARLGARKVFAVEPNPLVRLGPALAAANGFAPDHIEFYEMFSTEFEPPEQADVIFADLRGRTPLYAGNVPALYDAATRLLKPGGVLIPQRDLVSAALVACPSGGSDWWDHWNGNPFGFDLSPALELQMSRVLAAAVRSEQMLSAPELVADIRYGVDPVVDIVHHWRTEATADGTVAGIASWFDGTLVPGVTVSNGPHVPPSVYGGAFLGFTEPFAVRTHEQIEVGLNVRFVGGEYEWSWSAGRVDDSGHVRQRSVGSSLLGTPMTPRSLALLHDDRTVESTARLQADALGLRLLAAGSSVGEVADRLHAEFPETFPTRVEGKDAAVGLANAYGHLGRV